MPRARREKNSREMVSADNSGNSAYQIINLRQRVYINSDTPADTTTACYASIQDPPDVGKHPYPPEP